MKKLARTILLILAASGICDVAEAQGSATTCPATTVEKTLAAFVRAFDDLDWPVFKTCFASDVTMFHPAAPLVRRIDSPESFETAWLGVFARIKKDSGRQSPPYMNLQPEDVRIQMLSPEIALVTFHLVGVNTISRRTILLRQDEGLWKIVHIHASNLTTAAP